MDLISAHRHGLAEQLRDEAAGLAGRPQDGVQRAIVLHHLFDHSGRRHAYALLAAEGALALDPAIAAMRKAVRRSWWRLGPTRRAALAGRIDTFAAALRTIDRARCEALWVAYRAAQHGATHGLVPERLGGLVDGVDGEGLFLAHQAYAETEWGLGIETALAELAWPLSGRTVRPAIEALRIPIERFRRGAGDGFARLDRVVRSEARLPAGFAANPAQHYYALQRAIAAKRRSEQAQLGGIPVEDTVRLAVAA